MSAIIQLGIQTYFSPDDDTQAVFLRFLQQAQTSIYIAIYGFHLPPAQDLLIAKAQAGVPVAIIMDHTQADGKYEAPEVQHLIQGGCAVTIGSSEKHHIMHHKFAVVDDLHVLAGSWNFSQSASLEDNFLQITSNTDHAALFIAKWHEMHDWMHQYEPQWQPRLVNPPKEDV